MQLREMPVATFRCSVSGHQASARLTYQLRRDGKPDSLKPVPKCPASSCSRYRQPMDTVVQIDDAGGFA
jgi:hypothetical protein